MKVGIIQSCYIPWRGYFDFINSADVFVIFDDVRYPQGRSWRNRNQVKTPTGLKWLTVPILKEAKDSSIDKAQIAEGAKPWQEIHRGQLRVALADAHYFRDAIDLWERELAVEHRLLSSLNVCLIRSICKYLKIATPIVMSSDYPVSGEKTTRLIELLKVLGATSYLSGPSADGYLDKEAFREAGIRLEYKSYDYAPYPQLWGPFEGAVSVLDLIANCGPQSNSLIRSKTPNRIVVP
jgi:hypothetical protein